MSHQSVRWIPIVVVVSALLVLNGIFFYLSPETVVSAIGVNNTYLTIFLIAALGGLNSLTSGVFYSSLVAFAAGGADPLFLGVLGGLGIAIGDVIMFSLFAYGYKSIGKTNRERINRYTDWARALPRWLQFSLAYIYLALSPLPNDILMLALVLLGFHLRSVIPLVIAGGITIATVLAYGGSWWFVGG